MNKQISRLFQIAQKKERMIIGLMSGTSLDGLDIALCRVKNSGKDTKLDLLKFETLEYDDSFRNHIRQVFAKRDIDQQILSGLNALVGSTHAQLVNHTLKSWNMVPGEVDLIASHGQTVYHAPYQLTQDVRFPSSTLQIGDGDHIAVKTGIITLSDFRQKHVAVGGEGAPLAVYGDYLLFCSDVENRILLNIGGISNFTFLPKRGQGLLGYATDIGPGNTLMNQYMFRHFGIEMDRDGQIAQRGKVHDGVLRRLMDEEFLKQPFPKTTGPELFNVTYLDTMLSDGDWGYLAHDDIMATLCQFTAQSMADAIRKATQDLDSVVVYVSGGGLHNPLLMRSLRQALPGIEVDSFERMGFNPDAKEACLFAVLANESLAGSPTHVANLSGSPAVCMGKISLPH